MKILLILLSLILSLRVFGQPIDEALQLLKDKKLQPLKEFVEESKKNNLDVNLEIFREIIPGFKEGTLEVHSQTGVQKGTLIRHVTINFLSSDQDIFYYNFYKYSVVDSSGKFKNYNSLTDSFTNIDIYRNFEKQFFDIYGSNVNKNDLFQTIVYGNGCGIAAMPPLFQRKLDSLIKIRDIKTIRLWLRSPDSEKQLYAVQGILRLGKDYISVEDKNVIDVIGRKKGMVNVCYGCLRTQDGIQKLFLEISNSTKMDKHVSSGVAWYISFGTVALFIILLLITYKQKKKYTSTM